MIILFSLYQNRFASSIRTILHFVNFTISMATHQSINPILIRVYPHKQDWPDLPLLTPTLHLTRFKASSFSKPTLLLNLHLHSCLPCLLWLSSLPLPLHLKLQHFSQNMPIILPQNMPVPSHSIHLCLNTCLCVPSHSPLPSEPLFPSIPTSPLGPLSSFSYVI